MIKFRSIAMNIAAFVSLLASLLISPVAAVGDGPRQAGPLREQLVGTWTLLSDYAVREDGSRMQPFGTDPKGIFMLDASGRFSYLIVAENRPKFASNNRREGTPEEYKAAVQGIIAFFGTYSVDEDRRVVTWHIERCVFPNWDGTDRNISVAIDADEMSFAADPIPSASGPYTPHVTWKRAP